VCNAKRRWQGRRLVDHFASEFPMRSRDYYEWAVRAGRIRVEGEVIGEDHEIRDSMRIRHLSHRHEPACLGGPISVAHECPDYVVVSKPAGMPVHPAGQYHKNTVTAVMLAQRPDLGDLNPTHRLDKPVSGLLVLARHSDAARRIGSQITAKEVRKEYVARVLGEFPAEPVVVDVALSWDAGAGVAGCHPGFDDPDRAAGGSAAEVNAAKNRNNLHKGMSREERVAAVERQAAGGDPKLRPRYAVTEFVRLRVEPRAGEAGGATSIVLCKPLTGRTHQIRAHLAHAGHPIANDANYGGTMGTGDLAFLSEMRQKRFAAVRASAEAATAGDGGGGAAGGGEDPARKRQRRASPAGAGTGPLTREGGSPMPNLDEGDMGVDGQIEGFPGVKELRVPDGETDEQCPHCPRFPSRGFPIVQEALWLHALRYSGEGWKYQVPPPPWADGVEIPE